MTTLFCLRCNHEYIGHTLMRISLTLAICFSTSQVLYAQPTEIVAVLFEGFSGSSSSTGIDSLNTTLKNTFGNDISSDVFGHSEQQKATDFIVDHLSSNVVLVLIGHSLGGDSVIELAQNWLSSIEVDLTIQIDAKGTFDEILPINVKKGMNYYQESTGATEIQGATYVQLANNINVELLFNVSNEDITHTTIDGDERLHQQIVQNIKDLLAKALEPKLLPSFPLAPTPEIVGIPLLGFDSGEIFSFHNKWRNPFHIPVKVTFFFSLVEYDEIFDDEFFFKDTFTLPANADTTITTEQSLTATQLNEADDGIELGQLEFGVESPGFVFTPIQPVDLILKDATILSGEIREYAAISTITAGDPYFFLIEGRDTSGGDVTFKAGQKITLKPGVTAQKGSKFRAFIDPTIK